MPADTKDLTFNDIIVLQKVDADTYLEKFGPKIGAAFFEAANLLGSLKLKGYVDIQASISGGGSPFGHTKVVLTENGASIVAMAEEKALEPIDDLDKLILGSVAQGAKDAKAIAQKINVRTSDLAFHAYKLVKQGYLDYNLHAGNSIVVLTEDGFRAAGTKVIVEHPPMQAGAGGQQSGEPKNIAEELAPSEAESAMTPAELKKKMWKSKMAHYKKAYGTWVKAAAVVIVLALLAAVYFLFIAKR